MANQRIALVTGANSGLGRAVTVGLARRGFRVVMVVRDPQRGEVERQKIASDVGGADLDLAVVDLSSQRAIRQLADDLHRRYGALHVLVNNAGNAFTTRQISPDGIEMSLAVNHLAPFLLTQLVMDLLAVGAPSRIINVGTRLDTQMQLDDLQYERRPYRGLSAYAQSKLGNIHFTLELAERLKGTSVTVNCVHPGVFRSNLGSSGGPAPWWMGLVTRLGSRFLMSPEKAAERVLYLATDTMMAGVSGSYFGDRVALPIPAQPCDPTARRQVGRPAPCWSGCLPTGRFNGLHAHRPRPPQQQIG
ncbi:MAG: SDR family NAD(P)-dependent oxidoreductase [Anaerolineae bacterium]|nr:SDR family NAD(P)-dependent oxidoreductase [Anaerolineae bacterium]